ncbi:uncharacterized protein F5147DRAFT_658996 [Suillus discolor]|uniref:Fungal-type protein kinase domain-containing protein n=1 Tax=Suillus discolor TaxID=1912936 RepID=A0A9P7JLP2_9AGAM|nr:uncharacterized protein F5147DRAFT_658996 [Suillus discolor]KAG2087258.1 hypothetical protein F5147DRAFT_658996 [Suillus discolor]
MTPFNSHPVYFSPSANENKSLLPSLPPHIISTVLTDEPVIDSKQPKTTPHLSYQSDSNAPIGKIIVNNHKYILLKVLFSCQGLLGQGTMCYLASSDDEEYIIKDYWVKGNSDAILNKVKMLEEMKSVCTVETHQILHRDCNLNNIMIEDCEGNSWGPLIDWEFTLYITSDNTYPTSGTGMIPFMSIDLLDQMGKIQLQSQVGAADCKEASLSVPVKIEGIKHFYHDNLEALFYVFVWVCIALKGPANTRHQLNPLKSHPKGSMVWLPEEWHGTQLDIATCAKKKSYFFSEYPQKLHLSEQFDPYFKDLVPLAEEWYNILHKKRLERKKAEFKNTKVKLNKSFRDQDIPVPPNPTGEDREDREKDREDPS